MCVYADVMMGGWRLGFWSLSAAFMMEGVSTYCCSTLLPTYRRVVVAAVRSACVSNPGRGASMASAESWKESYER